MPQVTIGTAILGVLLVAAPAFAHGRDLVTAGGRSVR